MIEILFMVVVATKQPSCPPPPPPPPERPVAVIPRKLELVTVKEEREFKEGKEDVASPSPLMRKKGERELKEGKEDVASLSPLMRKMAKIPQAKRQFNRRGVRNK